MWLTLVGFGLVAPTRAGDMTDEVSSEIEIYWGSGSPYAWRVLMTAALKNIPFASRQLQFFQKEQRAPTYLAVNERGEVPALRHGALTLAESVAIMTYLDARFPDPPMFGGSAAVTGQIWQGIFGVVYHFEPAANRIINPAFSKTIDDHADDMRAAAGELHKEFARIDKLVDHHPWLVGDTVSAADIVAHTYVEFLLRIASRDTVRHLDLGFDTVAQHYPALCVWRERTTGLNGYDTAYPPHWRAA